jgi:hypothetical protein
MEGGAPATPHKRSSSQAGLADEIYTEQMLEAPDEDQSFPHKEITEQIIGAAFEVYRQS